MNMDSNIMLEIKDIEPIVYQVGDCLFKGQEWKAGLGKLLW